jgi:hypothetical protein
LNWTEEELTILIRVLNHTTDIRTLEYIVLVCWCSARNPLDRAEATRYEIGYNLCLCVRCRLRFCVVILRWVSVYNSLLTHKPVFFAVCLSYSCTALNPPWFLVYSLIIPCKFTCTFPVYRYGVTETLLTVLSGHINGHIDTREHHRLVECLGTLTSIY